MKKETKKLKGELPRSECMTIRFPYADYAYAMRESFGVGVNAGVLAIFHTMQHLEAAAWESLKGKVFEPGEWQLMALSWRYEPIEGSDRLDPNLLQYSLVHSMTAAMVRVKYGVDIEALCDKLAALSPLGALAVCTRCRDFWLSNENWRSDHAPSIAKFNDWANY